MKMVSLPPVCDTTNLSQRLSFENNNNNNNNLREASFSSYLNHAEKEFVRKLAESSRDQSNSTAITSTKEEEDNGDDEDKNGEDIEVFGAEKYFNGGIIENPTPKTVGVKLLRPRKLQQITKKPEQEDHLRPKKQKSSSRRSGTPSVRSDSSCTSQNALLQNNRAKNPSAVKMKQSQAKGFFYKCSSCFDKNSVEVDAVADASSSGNTTLKAKLPVKGRGLNFNSRNNNNNNNSISKVGEVKNFPLKMQIQLEDHKDRKSIEVFRSSVMGKQSTTLNLEKRLSMMSWNDVTPRVKTAAISTTTTTNSSSVIYNDDAESDASSDLFEIDSFTGKTNSYIAGQGSDCTDCVTPTTAYAPSEASIDWSVITASAADFSITSDYEDRRLSTTSPPVRKYTATTSTHKIESNYMNNVEEIQRRRARANNLMGMGCQSQKAVRVVESLNITNEKLISSEAQVRERAESFGRMTRFEAETKVMGFSSNQRQHAFVTNSLPRQYPPRISSILYV